MRRFSNLDGLRGIAALVVAVFHANQAFKLHLSLPNAPLAVDFFFVLSGFVLAHAYGAMLSDGRRVEYLRARVVRLYPLIVFGAAIGLGARLIRGGTNPALLAVIAALSAMGMPYLGHVPFSRTIAPLNPPAWSLFFELVASVAFAFGLWSGPRRKITVAFAMIAMMGVLAWTGEYNLGVQRFTFPMGFVRVASSFGIGVWLYESRPKVPHLHVGWLALLLVLVLAFPVDSPWLQAAALFAIFPFIVLSGSEGRQWRKLCDVGGDLSYPLYLTHSPLYVLLLAAGAGRGLGSVTLGLACAIPFAWLVLKLYDEPVRRWLARPRRQMPNHDSSAPASSAQA